MVSAGRSGALGKASLKLTDEALILELPGSLADLDGERLRKRFQIFAGQFERKFKIDKKSEKTADDMAL